MLQLFLLFAFIAWAEGDCPGEDTSLAPLPNAREKNLLICEAPYRYPNCTCPSSMLECACQKIGKCKTDQRRCVDMRFVFDGYNHCGDWSDELSESCPGDRFQCDCFNTTCPGLLGCKPQSRQCDEEIDCPDGTDEVNCTCPADKFECTCYKSQNCSYHGCIPASLRCNGYNDCGDFSDEVNCACPADKFECACYKTQNCVTSVCIPEYEQCDAYNNCGDWSDEVNCSCPSDKFECPCYKTQNCTKIGCIPESWQCDGKNDCGDFSDEANCTGCPTDKFECACYNKTQNCNYGGCIPKYWQCNGYDECGDWSDEVNCTCPSDEFECACYKNQNCAKRGCIPEYWQCNGYNNCGDWSDEVNCSCPAGTLECPCHEIENCTFGGCIPESWKCDGQNDCKDFSDEVNCTCRPKTFECSCYKTQNCTKRGCIPESWQCNGHNDCGDLSDEVNCTCPADKFQCACVKSKLCVGKELSCVNRSALCDGTQNCVDGSDETHFTCNCSGTYARCPCDPNNKHCPSSGTCISFDWIGDKVADCFDGSDEVCSIANITSQFCDVVAVTCPSERQARYLIHTNDSLECDRFVKNTCAADVNDCDEFEKVVCTTTRCSNCSNVCGKVFLCENQQVVANEFFCDGHAYTTNGCKDRSDEVRQGFGFKCSGMSRIGICILPQNNIYDSVAQCSDRSDICFVNGQFRCFQCLDRRLIVSSKQVCDGVVDCYDMSDECLCANQTVCNELRGDCAPTQMHCNRSSDCVDEDEVLCNTSVHCVNNINNKYCTQEQGEATTYSSLLVDKNISNFTVVSRWLTMQYGEENLKHWLSVSCDGIGEDFLDNLSERFCPNRFNCFANGKVSIEYHQVCDGTIDCDDKSDEILEFCSKTRYYCESNGKISIAKTNVCDGIIDCDDKSDESRCRCENTRFYCINGEPLSVENRLVQNGIDDCLDGSDECVNLVSDAFADVNEMIANPFYRGIFWMTGILALGGNLLVLATTTKCLINANKDQNLFINTSIFILNLCISDFLMGAYLLAISIKATIFSGSYCLFDKLWRSSSLCSVFGALAVISSEASAFTMTAMTTFRLISAFKPFLMRNVSFTKTFIAELFCWVFAVALAIIPLLNTTSEYFVSDVWYPNNFFGMDFVSRENMTLLAKRISNSEPNSWYDVKRIIETSFPRNPIKGEFGYYGETSVCIPRFFASTSDFAWEYSTFLITLNFFLFIYMVVAYLLIYKRSNRMKGSRSTDVSSKMQKRITRLILTDFCCWVPICVMGFVSVGGVKMPGDAYVLSACLLLPINSALNPLLYSKALEEQLSKMKKWISPKISSLRTSRSNSFHLGVKYNAHAEREGARVIEIIE